MTAHSPFRSLRALEQDFADGLLAMLEKHRGLGVYILVLANAAYDPRLWQRLSPALAVRHDELARTLRDALREGRQIDEPDDDVSVFLKLDAIGFGRVGLMESRRAGPWQVAFNPVRALRPPRISGTAFDALLRPFDGGGFHFNKPFLMKEVLWEGELAGAQVRMLYNKFPFARLHGLLVPEPLREAPQFLTAEAHAWAWEVCATAAVPGLCLGYNSYGAGASVNHLHFQSFVQTAPLPIQDARFAHNGGTTPYPLACQHLTERAEAWDALERLHRRDTPYNLVYSQTGMHLVARTPQDAPCLNARVRGYGWSEMAGVVTRFSRKEYEGFGAPDFADELALFAA